MGGYAGALNLCYMLYTEVDVHALVYRDLTFDDDRPYLSWETAHSPGSVCREAYFRFRSP